MPEFSSPLFSAVPDQRRFPILTGAISVDVAVIGGGIAGVMTAWRLAQNGKRVALLEQNHLATGDTGFTTSFVIRSPDTPLAPLEKKYGIEAVHKVVQAADEAQNYLKQTIRSEHIDCNWVDCASFNCAYESGNIFLNDEWRVVQQVDQRASWVRSETDAEIRSPMVEAIRYEGEGYFNVRKFIFGLLQRPTANNIHVFEESEVMTVETTTTGVHVSTSGGSVSANSVVVCTGMPIKSFPELRGALKQSQTFAIAARYKESAPITNHTFWDTDHPYQYYRHLDDQTIILGGADRHSTQEKNGDPHTELEQFLRQRFPGNFQVTHRWSGSLFETSDGLPYISQHPHYPGRVYVAAGFDGNGMVMGTLAGMVLGDLAAERENVHAPLFDFSRTGIKIPKPTQASRSTPSPSKNYTTWWLLAMAAVFFAVLILPGFIFFSQRGGFEFLKTARDIQSFGRLIFPLFGLYAFTLVWIQVMLGSNLDILRPKFRWIERFHRVEGVFAFLFAWTHPTLILIGVGLANYLPPKFVAPNLVPFVYLGEVQLFLLTLTVATALLRKRKWLRKYWHAIHLMNYVTFSLVWIHSWFLGSDVKSTNLRYLWFFYLLTVAGALVARMMRSRPVLESAFATPTAPPAPTSAENFVTVAKIDQVTEGHPFCANVNGQQIAVFKFGEKFYALDNICSHAGGPLCDGDQEGNTVTCPLHQSIFDITTGAVKRGPAVRPQKTYPVKIANGSIQLQA